MDYQLGSGRSSLVMVALLNVVIRRDAMTITPITVPEYELPILAAIHSKENVQEPPHGTPVFAGEREVDADSEFGRLAAKYGDEMAVKVYGESGEKVREMVFEAGEKYAAYLKRKEANPEAPVTVAAGDKQPKETAAQRKAREKDEREKADALALALQDPESEESKAAAVEAAAAEEAAK